MKGTKAFVQIHKRTAEVKPVDTKKPYNLVADFDGVVVRCEVTAGMTMVKAGDTVVNGQLLVSGIVDSKSLGFKIVHAAGKIFANTQHNYRVEVAFRQTVKKYTGREETKTSFNMLGAEIDLYFSEDTDFELYDAITVYEDVTLFDVISMPFYLKKNIFSLICCVIEFKYTICIFVSNNSFKAQDKIFSACLELLFSLKYISIKSHNTITCTICRVFELINCTYRYFFR